MTSMDVRRMLILAEEMPAEPHVVDYGALIAAEARHSGAVLGQDVYPTVAAKAAALLHGLLRVEALDRRNRTFAWLIALRYLALNDVPLPKVDPSEAVEILDAARQGEMGVHDLTLWLERAAG
ncbi:hypothetical protein GCM10029978_036350 [Actinoallomurus acanthiterrae]